jgi:G6PDH family F420-dependent oxidoreductase
VGIALAMTSYGYTLMGEGHDPRTLVRNAVRAEEEGFDFLVFSDHYHPWLPSQEHSPFVWSVLGAVAEATERIELATMVTCPIVRYHPAIIAQAAATIGVMSDGRFTLGLGTGERLNEHVVGAGWPPADVRQEMLAEAIEVMRRLWSGEYVSHRGPHFTVEDARIFDLPEEEIPVFVAAGGPQAARLAAEAGDGICATEPDPSLVETFAAAGGAHADTWGQLALSWHRDREAAVARAHDQFRFGVPGWKVMAELPNPVSFEAATATVRPEDVAESVPCGPDPAAHAAGIGAYVDAGFERVAVVDVGEDTEGFFRFWTDELRPVLPSSSSGTGA